LQIEQTETLIVTNKMHVMAFLTVLVSAALAPAQTFNVLYNFTGGVDGSAPVAGVIQDQAGNLYGTTMEGASGACPYGGCGVVYKFDTAGTETVLHAFVDSDGAWPVAPVVRDGKGNLYGTTEVGGSAGYGTVFKIETTGREKVLYNFTGGLDGCEPEQGLVRDKTGNLYGTTYSCSPSGDGTIFKVDSAGKFTLHHSFTGSGSDGANPQNGRLAMDESGNLYGVTPAGGLSGCRGGCGVLYELSKNGTFTVLHSFASYPSDGCNPYGSVLQDQAGNLYGTTSYCGYFYKGTIWRVSRKGHEAILHSFRSRLSDGCYPEAGVARDAKGNLYGVTLGCDANGYGALYELSASGGFTLLHRFDASDGNRPRGEVLRTSKGTLFGTTVVGGTYGYGTVWSYAP